MINVQMKRIGLVNKSGMGWKKYCRGSLKKAMRVTN